jgi:hypothetical protein
VQPEINDSAESCEQTQIKQINKIAKIENKHLIFFISFFKAVVVAHHATIYGITIRFTCLWQVKTAGCVKLQQGIHRVNYRHSIFALDFLRVFGFYLKNRINRKRGYLHSEEAIV